MNSSIKVQFSTVCGTFSFCLVKITNFFAAGERATQLYGGYALNPKGKAYINIYIYIMH